MEKLLMKSILLVASFCFALPAASLASQSTASGTLADGEQVCLSGFGFLADAEATLEFDGTPVNGKLTIWDNTAGVRLVKVTGTSPLETGTVESVSGENADLESCLTNKSGVNANYSLTFNFFSGFP